MTSYHYRATGICFALVGLGTLAACGLFSSFRQAEAADPAPAQVKTEPVKPKIEDTNPFKINYREDEKSLRKAGQAYIEALNKGDIEAITAFWSPEADYFDAAGKQIRGRDAIVALIKESMAGLKGYKAKGKMLAIKFLKPDIAIEDGSLEYVSPDGSRSANRYTVVWIKTENRWLISNVRDLPTQSENSPSIPYPHLSQFEWLVGEWEHGDSKGGMKLYCHWAPNKSFLLMDYTVSRENMEPLLVAQRLGWDPTNRSIRSWVFDSLGGFGEGAWNREGNRWAVSCEGILPDGGSGSASNSYEFVDANTFVWRGVNRMVEGQPLADSEVKFVRKAPLK